MSIIKVDKITQLSDSVMNEETGDITITRKFPITLAEAVICDFDGDPETVNENLLQALEKRNVGIIADESGKTMFVDMEGNEVMCSTSLDQIYVDKEAGVVMSDLNVGDINTPVYIENGIPKACYCESGAQGVQGLQGAQGVQGYQGSQGLQGYQGVQGTEGVQGYQGVQGTEGYQGVQGVQGSQGSQGIQGYQGNQGVQGYQGVQGKTGVQGNKGIQGIQGSQGIQGIKGYQGFDGKTGSQGAKGTQGNTGLRGVQGETGFQGSQGAQGRTGSKGVAGYKGAQGAQGVQGGTGSTGIQGITGCRGFQGKTGMTGPQGVQGKKGVQGTKGQLGYQGTAGAQGAQGIQGGAGPRGWMGYQGADGEVGIQGVTGEKGSVWVDGIRLDGYNTHLFTYNVDEGKFNPKSNPEDLLYIRNGAVIKIWMDQDAYDAISVDGKIHIDRLEDGEKHLTEYPVYYSGTTPMMSVVNPINDIDTVIEFTYRDEAWYYSGGLLTPTITEDIIVKGVELGQLHENARVPAGITIQELFTRLLVKEIDVHPVLPTTSISLTGINNGDIFEVGDSVNSSFVVSYKDGKFVGDKGYDYEINAGCVEGDSIYYINGNATSEEIAINQISANKFNFNLKTSYSESTVTPRTNIENISEQHIDAGSASSKTISITGQYKYFFGKQERITESTIDIPSEYHFTTQESLENLENNWLGFDNDNTLLSRIDSSSDMPSFVIVVPENWTITATHNTLGQDVDIETTWYPQNTIDYVNNGIHTTYQVYSSPSTEATSYKDIVITRN